MRMRRYSLALIAVLGLTACASGAGGPRADSSLLTAEQLDALGPGVSAYEAIERLRPTWLRDRGTSSPNPSFAEDTQPRVHVDSSQFPIEALRSMRTTDIQSIRFMDSRDATTRFGTGYVNGLIEITTRGQTPPGR